MNFEQLYPSRFLRAGDLVNGPETVTVASVGRETVGNEPKVIVAFADGRKLIANKTNGKLLAKMFGHDTTEWTGKSVTLTVVDVQFKDDLVPGIRVQPASKAASKTN